MKPYIIRLIAIVTTTLCLNPLAEASGWSRNLTVTSVGDNDISGEVVQITVNEIVDNPGHCANSTGYAIRNAATLKGSLALLSSAFVAGRLIDLFVTGTCDATGMPLVIGVILH
jgi:hypothetical protein